MFLLFSYLFGEMIVVIERLASWCSGSLVVREVWGSIPGPVELDGVAKDSLPLRCI